MLYNVDIKNEQLLIATLHLSDVSEFTEMGKKCVRYRPMCVFVKISYAEQKPVLSNTYLSWNTQR